MRLTNNNLFEELIQLGYRCGPTVVLTYSDVYHLVRAVRNGHAKLTKEGRKRLSELRIILKRNLGEI